MAGHRSEARSRSQRAALRAAETFCHNAALHELKGNTVGSWGPGIFDNDAARDHLFEVTRALAEQIDQALADAISVKLAGRGSDHKLAETLETVLPNIEIMCVLHESLGGGFLPEPESADEWQSQFEQLERDGSADRREVVRSTFARLRRHVQQCWEE